MATGVNVNWKRLTQRMCIPNMNTFPCTNYKKDSYILRTDVQTDRLPQNNIVLPPFQGNKITAWLLQRIVMHWQKWLLLFCKRSCVRENKENLVNAFVPIAYIAAFETNSVWCALPTLPEFYGTDKFDGHASITSFKFPHPPMQLRG